MSNRCCRLGLAGLGEWARRAYLPNVALMEEVRFVAVSTRGEANRRASARWLDHDTEVLVDWRALLDRRDLDGLIVATAPETHAQIAIAALGRDLPVLCEKPLGQTLEECDRVLRAENRTRAFLQVGFEFRHAPVIRQAKGWIEEGRLGEVTQLWCHVFRDKRDSPLQFPDRWTEHGGVFVEFLCHYFDLLTCLAGAAPKSVSGVAGQQLGTGAWDHGWVNLEYLNGALGHLGFSLLAPREAEHLELRVAGDGGLLEIDLRQGKLQLVRTDGQRNEWRTPDPGHPSKPYPGSYEQVRHFIDCIRKGTPSPVDGQVGRQMLAVGLGAEQAATQGIVVALI